MISSGKAKGLLEAKRDQIDGLKKQENFSPQYKKWYRDTHVAIKKIFGSTHTGDFTAIRYTLGLYTDSTPDSELSKAFHRGLDSAASVLDSMIEELEIFGAGEGSVPHLDPSLHVTELCDRFHLVVRQIRHRHAGRETLDVNDEYDVQDLLHSLLHLKFDDVRAEEWTPSYAGGHARSDFLVKNEMIVIEVKKTRSSMSSRVLGDQLIIDITRYQVHPDCAKLICFVYDPEGRIGNPRGMEADLTGMHDSLTVEVIIRP